MLLSICVWLKPKETVYVDLFLGGPRHKPLIDGMRWLKIMDRRWLTLNDTGE